MKSLPSTTEFVCYDDGCHLRRFARNPSRAHLTPIAAKLANTEIVIDKMHMAGHTDAWCHLHCDPKLFKELDNVSIVQTLYMYIHIHKYLSYRLTLKYVSSTSLGCPSMLE